MIKLIDYFLVIFKDSILFVRGCVICNNLLEPKPKVFTTLRCNILKSFAESEQTLQNASQFGICMQKWDGATGLKQFSTWSFVSFPTIKPDRCWWILWCRQSDLASTSTPVEFLASHSYNLQAKVPPLRGPLLLDLKVIDWLIDWFIKWLIHPCVYLSIH